MKKCISVLTALVMTVTMLSGMAFAQDSVSIEVEPAVFLCGDIYNIVWSTDKNSTGYVEYTYQGDMYRVYDEEAGVVRTDDYIHTVSVPVDHLDGAGAYTITSVAVAKRTPYSVEYGASCSTTRSFVGYHGQEEINIWTLSDLHRTPTNGIMSGVLAAASHLKGGSPDIVMLLGDICNDMQNKDYAEIGIFDTAAQLSGGSVPCVYTRGNHETRGEFSGYLLQYLPSSTGEFYFTFEYGPLSSVVLDFGEDKIDTHPEYSGLVDYNNYRIEENDWLNTIDSYTGDPVYRIAFCHGPNIIDHFGFNWIENLSDIGTDILVSGHYHAIQMWEPDGYNSQYCIDFPIMLDGSHINNIGFNISQLLLKDGQITCYGVSDSGEDMLDYELTAGQNIKQSTVTAAVSGTTVGSSAEGASAANTEQMYTSDESAFIEISSDKGSSDLESQKGASADFGFITKPTVFDTGDTYTVAWATTEGQNSMGEVHLIYEGKEMRFTDSEGGTLRCLSNLHAVRIPKKYLENNKYEVISQQIFRHGAYNSDKGALVTSGYIEFSGYDGQSEIEMLMVSDLGSDRSMIPKIRAAAQDYDVVVFGGNIISDAADDSAVINGLLYNCGMLTGGKIPAVFVRGENETLGEYAPYLTRIIRNSTRQFYEYVQYGPVSLIVLDTAGLFPDSSSEYNGLASFETVRQKQQLWLEQQSYGDAQYKVALAHAPVIHNYLGYKYSMTLNTLGTDLALFGHGGESEYNDAGFHNQNYVSAVNGMYEQDGTVATLISFSGGDITVRTLGDNGVQKLTKTFSASDNDNTASFSDVAYGSWYADAVKYSASQLVMRGVSENTFAPTQTLTRAMAVTVLARLADIDTSAYGETGFEDVASGLYYSGAVAWAHQQGITNGTDENLFSPDQALTRQQLCAMVYRMYKDRLPQAEESGFDDFDSVSEYAKKAVASLEKAGIINGMGNGKFEPGTPVTRAMLAQIIYKANF